MSRSLSFGERILSGLASFRPPVANSLNANDIQVPSTVILPNTNTKPTYNIPTDTSLKINNNQLLNNNQSNHSYHYSETIFDNLNPGQSTEVTLQNYQNYLQDSLNFMILNQTLLTDISRRTDNSNFRIKNIEEKLNLIDTFEFRIKQMEQLIKSFLDINSQKPIYETFVPENLSSSITTRSLKTEKDPFVLRKIGDESNGLEIENQSNEIDQLYLNILEILQTINQESGFPKGLSYIPIILDDESLKIIAMKIKNIILDQIEESEYAQINLYSLSIIVKGRLIRDYSK